ncbi:hypothetical protein H8356DRAFT_1331901 [Neocallimastix lanati (nom. inval.)]|nr:hypothetical protein H8356DRAFT_1331901 [Neocallimastix sp. JGI-2020a]
MNSRFISILANEHIILLYYHETTVTVAYATTLKSVNDSKTFCSIENYNRYCLADSISITYDFDNDSIDNGITYDSILDLQVEMLHYHPSKESLHPTNDIYKPYIIRDALNTSNINGVIILNT